MAADAGKAPRLFPVASGSARLHFAFGIGTMAEKSVFREFMAALRKGWKAQVPFIRPVSEALGQLSKASTFYAGAMERSGQHVFLYFQHSSKAWEVGRFTINVVLSVDEHNPLMGFGNRSGQDFKDGYYRIGHLIGTKDKWWHLKQDDDSVVCVAWRPSSYGNPDVVLSEAVDDVTRDVLSAMQLLGIASGQEHKAESGAPPNGVPAEPPGRSGVSAGPPGVTDAK